MRVHTPPPSPNNLPRRTATVGVEHRQLALMISSTPAYTDSNGIPIVRAALSKRSS